MNENDVKRRKEAIEWVKKQQIGISIFDPPRRENTVKDPNITGNIIEAVHLCKKLLSANAELLAAMKLAFHEGTICRNPKEMGCTHKSCIAINEAYYNHSTDTEEPTNAKQ